MRHYTCDVCGEAMPATYQRRAYNVGSLAQICAVEDVCDRCLAAGERIDTEAVLMEAWRRNIRQTKAWPSENTVQRRDAQPKFASQAGEEKFVILERLKAYRAVNRLGCLDAVAKLSGPGITDDLLRDMLIGEASPPIEDWRRIGKALDTLEGGGEA